MLLSSLEWRIHSYCITYTGKPIFLVNVWNIFWLVTRNVTLQASSSVHWHLRYNYISPWNLDLKGKSFRTFMCYTIFLFLFNPVNGSTLTLTAVESDQCYLEQTMYIKGTYFITMEILGKLPIFYVVPSAPLTTRAQSWMLQNELFADGIRVTENSAKCWRE